MFSSVRLLILAAFAATVTAFVPTSAINGRRWSARSAPLPAPKPSAPAAQGIAPYAPSALRSKVVCHGLFGLGAPEIAVIVAVAGFVLGPQKLGQMARDLGAVAGELKDVPKEFQEGLAEGEDRAVITKEAAKAPADEKKEETKA